jgi:hypothetical protein
MNFLPDGFESLRTERPYWKMSQMQEGDNKIRIVQRPIAGWVDWIDNKPLRTRPEDKPTKSYDPDKPMKAFWACYVWDYSRRGLFILEITQASIIKALMGFGKDEDWGDFTKYDLKIKKEGTGKETRYSITPLPHKEFQQEITEALKKAPVKLENLYSNGDPWDVTLTEEPRHDAAPQVKSSGNSMDQLKTMLIEKGLPIGYLDQYVQELVQSSPKPTTAENVVNSALMPSLFPRFASKYANEVARMSA